MGRGRTYVSLLASLGVHAVVLSAAFGLAWWSLRAKETRALEVGAGAPDAVIALDLPVVSDGTLLSQHDDIPEGESPTTFGGANLARVDDRRTGRGGDTTGAPATNLAAYDDKMRLDPDLLSNLERDQQQRLRSAQSRATREDRRSTTSPTELTFLATPKTSGEHRERRPDSAANPSRGSLASNAPDVLGGHVGAAGDREDDGPSARAGAQNPGSLLGSPGLGVRDGLPGSDHRKSARVMLGRPSVTEGAPSVTSAERGRTNDSIDSDQEVSNAVRAIVHASVAGGIGGQGRGGATGPESDPGAGGSSGKGSVARPLGTGEGEVVDWWTTDPSLMPYFRKIHAKVDPLWRDAFPKSAMIELKQGTVILEFTISADGVAKVSWPPIRASGIEEFDKNCADAIRRASPFEPIPAALHRTTLRIRAPFVARNPIVK